MFSFSAYFWNSDVYIGRNKYLSNEILISYLTMDTTELRIALDELTRYKAALLIDFEGSYNYRKKYNNNVYSAMDTFQRIDSWLAKLPPYNKILRFPRKPFNDLLNEHSIVFEDGIDYDNDEMITEDTVNEYGFGYKDDCGNYNIYINNFQLIEFEHLLNILTAKISYKMLLMQMGKSKIILTVIYCLYVHASKSKKYSFRLSGTI